MTAAPPPSSGFFRLRLILPLAAVVALGAGIYRVTHSGGHAGGDAGHHFGGGATPVVVASAVTGDIPEVLDALGTVTPLATVTVKTQIAGQLTRIAFKEGQTVKAGDFLAQIDPRPYQAQLEQYRGQLARDQALLREARLDLARYQTLVAQDSIARQQLDTQRSLVDQYLGAVATDQAEVDTARLNLTYCHITAPVSGRVGLRQVDQGNYVQTSDSGGIVVITQEQPISVVFTLPEDDLPAVARRLRAGARLPVEAFDRAQSVKLADGTLATLDNQIDSTTGTVKLRALFSNSEEALFPQQFVNAVLHLDTLRGVTVIPSAGVQRGVDGTFVYVVKADNTVTMRPVTLGPVSGERVAVLKGLKAGEQLVVDGTDRLREGSKVAPHPLSEDQPAAPHTGDGAAPARRTRPSKAQS